MARLSMPALADWSRSHTSLAQHTRVDPAQSDQHTTVRRHRGRCRRSRAAQPNTGMIPPVHRIPRPPSDSRRAAPNADRLPDRFGRRTAHNPLETFATVRFGLSHLPVDGIARCLGPLLGKNLAIANHC